MSASTSTKKNQALDEPIADLSADVRYLSLHCESMADGSNKALRDRLMCALWNKGLQRRLLTEDKHAPCSRSMGWVSMGAADKNRKELVREIPDIDTGGLETM